MVDIQLPQIECPPSMASLIREIFNGEYDLPYSHPAPVILDIGANIGGFAIWAAQRWQNSILHCYEPLPSNFALLQRNLSCLDPRRYQLNNFAIGDVAWTRMFLGKNNIGEASFFDLGEQKDEMIAVKTEDASILPRAHILKIDTEGSEIEILQRHSSIEYDVILIEFHGEKIRRRIDEILKEYCLIGAKIRHVHRGVFKYIHRRLIPSKFSLYEPS
jgi:FkbM family methyltransferase